MKGIVVAAVSIALSAAACGVAAGADDAPGFAGIALEMAHRDAEVRAAVWYPAGAGGETRKVGENAVFLGVPVRAGAAVAPGRRPVILLSHGFGGRFEAIAWLPAGLARRGAVVISVNHPKSTTWDVDERQALEHWTRVQDLRAALDWLLGDPHWMGRVDDSRIAAVGFSFGGWTALSIGGATGNLAGYAAYCGKFGARAADCRIIAGAGIELGALDAERWNASNADRRITAIAAIDPALHYGLDAGNVKNLVDDVLLIGLGAGADRYLPTDFSPAGSGFGALLPHATTVVIAKARHLSALGTCKPGGAAILRAEGDDPVCDDPEGSHRKAVHRRIVTLIAHHLRL